MPRDGRKRVPLILDVFNLLEANDCCTLISFIYGRVFDRQDLLSTFRSIFNANTFCPSFWEPARHDNHTRAKVPVGVCGQ